MRFLSCACLPILLACNTFGQANTWVERTSFPEEGRTYPFSCSVGSKGYVVGGRADLGDLADTWEYDPATDAWTQVADFGGGGRYSPAGFVIDGRIYVGGGRINGTDLSDFWSYDPTNDVWEEIASCPGPAKYDAAGFSVNGKGYICCGSTGAAPYTNTMYQYDPGTNAWTVRAPLPSEGRSGPRALVVGNRVFLIGGWLNPEVSSEVWEYDAQANSWMERDAFDGGPRMAGVAFTVGGHSYFGCGYVDGSQTTSFWEYDIADDSWTQRASYGGPENRGAIGFGIDGRGYIGLGYLTGGGNSNELWEYAPIDVGIDNLHQRGPIAELRPSNGGLLIRNLSGRVLRLSLFDGSGKLVLTEFTGGSEERIGFDLAVGLYAYELEAVGSGFSSKGKILLGGSR